MYSYYSLPDRLKEVLERVESELKRPVLVMPAVPAGGLGHQMERLVPRYRELFELPHLTRAQAEDLAIVVSFAVDGPNREERYYDFAGSERGNAMPRDVQAFPLTLEREGLDDLLVGYVEPGRVVCTIRDLPYMSEADSGFEEHEDVVATWAILVEGLGLAADPEIEGRFEAARQERVRHAVTELVSRNQDRAISERRMQIESLEQDVRSYETHLTTAMTSVRQQSEELEMLLRMRDGDTGETLLREYDALRGHPRITSIDLEDTTLVLKTDMVVMTHPESGETRNLGRFEMRFTLSNNGVRLRNMDNPRHGRDHPHVGSGEPCFGGHQREFVQVLSAGRWSVLLELLFQYLETFNLDDDWGRYGAYWFSEPDWNPDEVSAGGVRGARVASDSIGEAIHVGDQVSFVSENGERTSGTAVTEVNGSFAVLRDDGVMGGGADGGWLMGSVDSATIRLERAAVAVPA